MALNANFKGFIAASQWFTNKQVEYEKNAHTIVCKFKFMGDNNSSLYSIDLELSER